VTVNVPPIVMLPLIERSKSFVASDGWISMSVLPPSVTALVHRENADRRRPAKTVPPALTVTVLPQLPLPPKVAAGLDGYCARGQSPTYH